MRRSKPWLTALLQLVILLAVVACATPWLAATESPLPIPRRSGDIALRGHRVRPVYNGSVVAGGVYATDEVRAAIARDPVVASHYRDVQLDEMQPVTLAAGRAAYVSYRIGDRIYWTRHRVWLKAGETVLTDGRTTIRARCGNCVSDVRQTAVAPVEPAEGELDDFVVPPSDTGVDAVSGEADERLGRLLDLPFGPQMLASLAPAATTAASPDDALGSSFPSVIVPPVIVPTVGGSQGGTALPAPFVPGATITTGTPDDSTTGFPTSGSPTTGTSTTGASTGSPADTLTTGFPTDTTAEGSTGTPTGDVATDTGGTSTTGTDSDGTTGPTTTGGGLSTSSSGTTPAPEPELLWLVATGVIGVASRRLRVK